MNIYVSQIYIEAGAVYPFSVHFQQYISNELTSRVHPSEAFIHEYGVDLDIIFRMSAKSSISAPVVKGPTVFKKDKDVEFTIFLPFDKNRDLEREVYRHVLVQLLDQIVSVLVRLRLDDSQVSQDSDEIIEGILADPKMLTYYWDALRALVVTVSLIRAEEGAIYPFSTRFQILLSKELTKRIDPSDAFVQRYGKGYNVAFNVGFKSDIRAPEVIGPTVDGKEKDVQFTIYVTFNKDRDLQPEVYRQALIQILDQIVGALGLLGLDTSRVVHDSNDIILAILTDPRAINNQ